MSRCIVKIKEYYLEWSTVTDLPITLGMTKEELEALSIEINRRVDAGTFV
jgi:hypothetical protein